MTQKNQTLAKIVQDLRDNRLAAKVRQSEIDLAVIYFESASHLAKLSPREIDAAIRDHRAAVKRIAERKTASAKNLTKSWAS